MIQKPSYFSVIPAQVRYDSNLKPNEKLLYSELTALSTKYGYSWAENSYFAKLYGVNKDTVSRWISNLEKQGYIRRELEYAKGTKQVERRYLYINDTLLDKKISGSRQKKQEDKDKKSIYPIDEKSKEELNNTRVNNTSNNTSIDNDVDEDFQEIKLFYEKNFEKLNPYIEKDIKEQIEYFGKEIVLEGLERTVLNQKKYNYAQGIFRNWKKSNVKNKADIYVLDQNFKTQSNSLNEIQYQNSSSNISKKIITNKDKKSKSEVQKKLAEALKLQKNRREKKRNGKNKF